MTKVEDFKTQSTVFFFSTMSFNIFLTCLLLNFPFSIRSVSASSSVKIDTFVELLIDNGRRVILCLVSLIARSLTNLSYFV